MLLLSALGPAVRAIFLGAGDDVAVRAPQDGVGLLRQIAAAEALAYLFSRGRGGHSATSNLSAAL